MKTIAITGGIGSGKSAVSALLSERGVPVYDADSRTKALYRGDLLDRIEAAFGRSFRLPPAQAPSVPSFPGLTRESSVTPDPQPVIPDPSVPSVPSAPTAQAPSVPSFPGLTESSFPGSSAPSFPGLSRESSVAPDLSGGLPRVDFAALAAVAFASEEALARLEAIVHPAVLADFIAWRESQEAPLVAIESAIILDKPLFDGSYDTVVLVYAPESECVSRVLARNPDLSEDAIRRRIAAQRTDFSRADYLLINDGPLASLAPQVDALVRHLLK